MAFLCYEIKALQIAFIYSFTSKYLYAVMPPRNREKPKVAVLNATFILLIQSPHILKLS